MRTMLRNTGRAVVCLLALYGGVHLTSTLCLGWSRLPRSGEPWSVAGALAPEQERVVSALARILSEDGVGEAGRWAQAIVRAAPTTDLGYVALVAAQIRRESHFLAADLEWLFRQLVPDLAHELGMPDPINTIGPMQVQRWTLGDVFTRALGRRVTAHEVKGLAADVEVGVAACVAVLDAIVADHIPDRTPRGWATSSGPTGMEAPEERVLARDWLGALPAERPRLAVLQKLLSDLTRTPLALDGVIGEETRRAAHAVAARLDGEDRARLLVEPLDGGWVSATVHSLWEHEHGVRAPRSITPRLAHDPRVAFVFADFNTGRGACRTAALQYLMRDVLAVDLAVDGKRGPKTEAAMRRLFAEFEPDARRRDDFLALVDLGHKRAWVSEQAFAIAAGLWRTRRGAEPPSRLIPDLWHDGMAQQIKGIGRVSVEGYVAGSTAVFEDYLARLFTYTGTAIGAAAGARNP